MNVKIGVLSYQGSVEEHVEMLNKIKGVAAVKVKTADALKAVDGIILPGGESTTIAKLLKHFELFTPLQGRIKEGMPVWGTCAGLILLAKAIEDEQPHLNVMNIKIKRNAYGRQLDSFEIYQQIDEFSTSPIPLIFIRAPWIDEVGEDVKILAKVEGHIVAARQDSMLVTSFHPELTDNLSTHKYFADMVQKHKDNLNCCKS